MQRESPLRPFSAAAEDKISSADSEGEFNEFIRDRLKDMLDSILSDGGMDQRGSEIIVEMNDIQAPRFSYGEQAEGGQGGQGQGPGGDAGTIRFGVSFEQLMSLVAERLGLPDLSKEGRGRIKEVSYEFKTFGPTGVILDRRRTFKRAIKTSIGTGVFDPAAGLYDVMFRRKDRRYKIPERVEKPRFKAVVFYIGDVSYSTWGERLDLEKRVVSFIRHWLDYNYGPGAVDHRYFVHDAEAREVMAEQFFSVENAGGTRALPAFELVANVAFNEYDAESTNFYAFYFGDGELFADDAAAIAEQLSSRIYGQFNRIGILEVVPSSSSNLIDRLREDFSDDSRLRMEKIDAKSAIVRAIRTLFSAR